MRRAGVVASGIFIVLMLAGCASADHSWRGEFDARLEGAARTVEAAREEVKPNMSPIEYGTVFGRYGESLFVKSRLVAELDPAKSGDPAGRGSRPARTARARSGHLREGLDP